MSAMGVGLIIFVVLFFSLGIGMVWMVRGSGKRYIVCGKSLPLILVGTMLTAQSIDANATIGNSSLTYGGGFWAGFYIPMGLAACLFLTGLFFAKPLNRMKLLTLPDFYFRRYNSSVELLTSFLMGISFIILVAGNFAGAAWIVSVVFQLEYLPALIIVAVVILLYTVAGGLFASAATDFVQIYPAIFGFVGCAVWLFATYGWDYFSQAIPAGFLDLSGMISAENGALANWGGFVALALGDVVALDFMERIFAARTPKTAQRGCYLAAGLTLVTGLSCAVIGLMSIRLLPDIADPRLVLPTVAMTMIPFIFGLLILAGVIGAGASTANGGILGVSTVLGRNIMQKNVLPLLVRKRAGADPSAPRAPNGAAAALSDRKLLMISRLMALPVVGLAVLLAFVRPEPGILLALAFDVVLAGCFVPLAAGLYWKKSNSPGAIAGILAGSVLRVILYISIPESLTGLDTMIPPLFSLVVFVGVCLLTQKTSPPRHHVIDEVPSDDDVVAGIC